MENKKLQEIIEMMVEEYETNHELTDLIALDSEDFMEEDLTKIIKNLCKSVSKKSFRWLTMNL